MTLIALLSPSKIALQRLGYVYFWEGPLPGSQIPSHTILPRYFRRLFSDGRRAEEAAQGHQEKLYICSFACERQVPTSVGEY